MDRVISLCNQIGKRQDFILAIILMAAVFMMILPLPTEVIDVLITFNLGLSIILLMMAIYIDGPLEFSAFPSLLLLTTLFRLALTISTSRLILLQHDAGHIVETFGNFVVGGNLIVGLIVFLIISVIQFIVITKGSERVAEVSARFSLDGMPGKQMSIDGDLRAGVIDAQEAKNQRAQLQKESQLYGAMDGAMKFVKGDAIASLLVIFINLVGGLCVGIFVHGMEASSALSTYAVLSIGDGLVDQIPGLLISITAGIIVTRVPDEKKQNLAKTLVRQITNKPLALIVATFLILVFALIPGFPFFDFLALAAITALLVLFSGPGKAWLKKIRSKDADYMDESDDDGDTSMEVQPLSIKAFIHTASKKAMKEKIDEYMTVKSASLGFNLPKVKLTVAQPERGEKQSVVISLYGTPVLEETFEERSGVIAKTEGYLQKNNLPFEKRYTLTENLQLHWVHHSVPQEHAADVIMGDDLITHLLGMVIDRHAKEFIGIQETRYLIDLIEPKYTELLKEVNRQLSVSQISEIFQRLVAESVTLKDLRTVFEALVEWSQKEKDILLLTEYVRINMQRHLSYTYSQGKGEVAVFMIGDALEQTLREAIRQTDSGAYLALTPEQSNELISSIQTTLETIDYHDMQPVFLTSMDVRRYLRKLLEKHYYEVPVLSFQELSSNIKINVLATV